MRDACSIIVSIYSVQCFSIQATFLVFCTIPLFTNNLYTEAMGEAAPTSAEPNGNGTPVKKQLIINAFVESCSGHQSPGLWQHPDDKSSEFNKIQHWVKLAQLLEKGKFHGMFIADVLVRHHAIPRGTHAHTLLGCL